MDQVRNFLPCPLVRKTCELERKSGNGFGKHVLFVRFSILRIAVKELRQFAEKISLSSQGNVKMNEGK